MMVLDSDVICKMSRLQLMLGIIFLHIVYIFSCIVDVVGYVGKLFSSVLSVEPGED